jgi:hypothetical protein
MRCVLWLTCFLLLSFAELSASPRPKTDKPLKIASIQPNMSAPPAQLAFDESVVVAFSSGAPAKINLLDPGLWKVIIFCDDGSRTFLQGTTRLNNGKQQVVWSEFTIDTNGVVSSTTIVPPTLAPNGNDQVAIAASTDRKTAFLVLPQDALIVSPHKNTVSLSIWIDNTAPGNWSYSKPTSGSTLFQPAASQSQADNYLTGSYSPAIHSAPQYSISGQGNLDFPIGSRVYLGAVASVETDNRPSANPDSFLVSGQLQWIPIYHRFLNDYAQGILVNWDFAGLEFDRATTTKTFVSSATAEMPLRLYPSPKAALGKFTSGLFPFIGATTGTNLSNALEPSGSGFIFRGVFGTSVGLTYNMPSVTWMQKISLTATDTARMPATNEIFTFTHYISATGKTVSLPVLSTRIRNHVTGELDLTIAKPFSISIQYEDGELPPAFKTIDNKVTVGVKIALQQTAGAQTKISPEK